MTTMTRWLLRAFADEWPGGLPESGETGGPLFLEDRNDATVLDVDTTADPTTLTPEVPSNDFDLNVGNVLGVALTGWSDTPAGVGGSEYRTEPVLSVRIEGAATRQHGHISDNAEFYDLWATAVEVVQGLENGTLLSAPVSGTFNAEPGEQSPQSDQRKDHYEFQFEVQPRAYRQV